MNNLDDYNLDDDLPFSPIDDENTDKKQKEEDKNGDTVSPESNIDSEEINNFFNPILPNEELKNDEKVNIVDNTNYVTNAEIDKDLSKEEKTDELNNNVFDNQGQENLINNITKDQEEQPGNIFKHDLEESILNGKKINNNDKNFKNVKNIISKQKSELVVQKMSKVFPVIAFAFVSILGIYIFLNNAKADNVNLIKIEEKAKTGYIDNSGEVIVKPKYLYGTDYYKGYAVVKNYNSLYGILDSKGKTKIAFGNIFTATLYGNRYVVSKFTSDGLKMGLLNENLDELTRFKYDNLTYSKSGVFIFTRDETMGIMNSDGKEIYTYKVDEVDDRNISIEISNLTEGNDSDLYAKIKINSSSTIINTTTGKEVYKYTLDDINVLDNNVFYIKNSSGKNKYFIIKNDKVVYESSDYKRIRVENLNSNIAIGIKEDASIDYINIIDKKVINNDESIKYTYSDGVILKEQYNFNAKKIMYTIYTPSKEFGTFSDLKPYDNKYVNGYLKIKTENDKYEFVNKKGNVITKKEYEELSDFNKNGYAIVSNDNLYGVIDSKGKEIIDEKYDEIIFLNDNLFKNVKKISKNELFIFKENNKYGIINSDGKVVIKANYDDFDTITTKYPIIEGTYNGEKFLINLNTLKELSIKVSDKVEIYDNYIISSLNYYNYNGEQIYTLGG
jgi:hypothetical protein